MTEPISGATRHLDERARRTVLAGQRHAATLTDRALNRLDDDTGAQTLEYAMLGGLGATIVVTLIEWLRRSGMLENLIEGFVSALFGWIEGLLG